MLSLVAVGTLSYWLLAIFVSGTALQEFFNSVVLGVAVAVVLTWSPAAYSALQDRAWGENQVVLAIFTIWFVLVLHRIATIAYISLSRPGWFEINVVLGFLGYLFMLTGILFLAAPANVRDPDPGYRFKLIAALVVGAAAAIFAFYAQQMGWTSLRDLSIRVK